MACCLPPNHSRLPRLRHRDVELLTFIRRARTLGLHLDDIREVLAIRHGGTSPCATVRDRLDARIAEIDAAVTDLLALLRRKVHRDHVL